MLKVAVASYVVNYTGALFRQYPGPWHVMLKQGNGSYACIAESATRFSLGEAKEELLRVLGLQEEEGSSLEFLRRGFKSATWWEEDVDCNISNDHHILYELEEQIHQKHDYLLQKKIKVVKLYSHRDRRVMVIKSCHLPDFCATK